MNVLYSKTSSKGNTSVIENATGDILIIDAGIKFEKVNSDCRYMLHNAEAVLLTHAHLD